MGSRHLSLPYMLGAFTGHTIIPTCEMRATEKLYFVNKNAQSSSLSRSHGQERRRIFSRAQASAAAMRPAAQGFIVITTDEYALEHGGHRSRDARRFDRGPPKQRFKEIAPSEFDPFQSFSISLEKDTQAMLTYCEYTLMSLLS